MDKVGQANLRHAMAGDCGDPDCEIHHVDVGVEEGVVTLTNVAFFMAGASAFRDQILNEIEDAFETIWRENFVHYYEEAIERDNSRPESLDAARHFELEDR